MLEMKRVKARLSLRPWSSIGDVLSKSHMLTKKESDLLLAALGSMPPESYADVIDRLAHFLGHYLSLVDNPSEVIAAFRSGESVSGLRLTRPYDEACPHLCFNPHTDKYELVHPCFAEPVVLRLSPHPTT